MKGLGEEMGFPGKQADSRIAQYESGNKMPRKDVILELAKILDINPTYLVEPDPEYIMVFFNSYSKWIVSMILI